MYRTESSKTEAVSGHHQAELERSSGVCASAKKECLLKGWIGWLVCEQTGHCVNFIPNEIQVTLVTSSLSTFP